ncbi:MAG: hypothetical protein PHU21_14710 [Elusimicrobia bacterium]|nr:hypothetical protein [Elusimicrobiota bacterium]
MAGFSLRFFICVAAGVAAGVGGWALLKARQAHAENDDADEDEGTSFVSPFSPAWFLGFFRSKTLLPGLGYLLLFISCFLLFMLAPMFYLAG